MYMYLCMYVYMIVEKKGSINDIYMLHLIFQGGCYIYNLCEIVITRFDIIRILNFYKLNFIYKLHTHVYTCIYNMRDSNYVAHLLSLYLSYLLLPNNALE